MKTLYQTVLQRVKLDAPWQADTDESTDRAVSNL